MTIEDAQKYGIKKLLETKVESPESSIDYLLRKILNATKEQYIRQHKKELTVKEEKKFREWVARRSKHEPVWYITGEIDFYGQIFKVNKDVLIPRPETELLIEMILKNEQKISSRILDVGTGSGAVILTLASKIKGEFYASDISNKALTVAKSNAERLKYTVSFKVGDLLTPWLNQKFDLVIANLPYVPHEEMPFLASGLKDYEPVIALDGGVRGLEIYKNFLKELPGILNPGASVYCEIGSGQGHELKKIAKKYFQAANINILKDYGGFDRFLVMQV